MQVDLWAQRQFWDVSLSGPTHNFTGSYLDAWQFCGSVAVVILIFCGIGIINERKKSSQEIGREIVELFTRKGNSKRCRTKHLVRSRLTHITVLISFPPRLALLSSVDADRVGSIREVDRCV